MEGGAQAGRGREDETATEIAVDTTTAIAIGPTSDEGTMVTGIEETMMGAEGIDMPIRKTNDLRGAVGVEDHVTPRTRTTTDQPWTGKPGLDYYEHRRKGGRRKRKGRGAQQDEEGDKKGNGRSRKKRRRRKQRKKGIGWRTSWARSSGWARTPP